MTASTITTINAWVNAYSTLSLGDDTHNLAYGTFKVTMSKWATSYLTLEVCANSGYLVPGYRHL